MTLDADVSSHSLTADSVVFDYYDASAAITATEPLGGPAAGGTVVTVHGSGFVDRGGVRRFGSAAGAVVPATLRSATELLCEPDAPADDAPARRGAVVRACPRLGARCAADATLLAERLDSLPSVASAAACHAACAGDPRCRYFSHHAAAATCDLCADRRPPARRRLALHVVAARRPDGRRRCAAPRPQRRPLGAPMPPLGVAPNYYCAAALVVSAVVPVGGPLAGGTPVLLNGTGLRRSAACAASLAASGRRRRRWSRTASCAAARPAAGGGGRGGGRAPRPSGCASRSTVSSIARGLCATGCYTPQSEHKFSAPGAVSRTATRRRSPSSVSPAFGPVAGGTALTVVGAGFYDLGARLGFVGADSKSSFVPASIAHGEFSASCCAPSRPPRPTGLGMWRSSWA